MIIAIRYSKALSAIHTSGLQKEERPTSYSNPDATVKMLISAPLLGVLARSFFSAAPLPKKLETLEESFTGQHMLKL
jgi:hypothetical protein